MVVFIVIFVVVVVIVIIVVQCFWRTLGSLSVSTAEDSSVETMHLPDVTIPTASTALSPT